jgi:hypothetical protein
MATRLLSFLSDIEKSLLAELSMLEGPPWETQRTVSYHQGLARMSLQQRSSSGTEDKGTIYLQNFVLADGSQCLKASLTWTGAPETQVIAVYAKPQVNWRTEAASIATAWISGPPAVTATQVTERSSASQADVSELLAAAG